MSINLFTELLPGTCCESSSYAGSTAVCGFIVSSRGTQCFCSNCVDMTVMRERYLRPRSDDLLAKICGRISRLDSNYSLSCRAPVHLSLASVSFIIVVSSLIKVPVTNRHTRKNPLGNKMIKCSTMLCVAKKICHI